MKIYDLTFIRKKTLSSFNIGFFSSYEKAEAAAHQYLTVVCGFCGGDFSYSISEKNLPDSKEGITPECIFIVYGWNDENDGNLKIIESDCFNSESQAREKLTEMKGEHSRTDWCIDRYVIDECDWQEGVIGKICEKILDKQV